MEDIKKIKLSSGADLAIHETPFKKAKALFNAALEELKDLKMDPMQDIDANFWKGLFCAGFSSKKIDQCLEECMKHVTYNGLTIDEKTFEPKSAREDYMSVCFEVFQENVHPFLKNLYAQLSPIVEKLKKSLA